MPNLPLKIHNAIYALTKNKDIDPDIVDAIAELYTDLQAVKSALYGVGRDGKGDFAIDNPSYRNKIGDQRALTLTKEGILNLGSQYGVRPDVMANVLGSMYAVPQWGTWWQSTVLAGDGSWNWDLEKFNNTYDLYQRTTGNTRIRIIVPGDYLVIAQVHINDLTTLVAGQQYTVGLFKNAAFDQVTNLTYLGAANKSFEKIELISMIQTTINTDFVEVKLTSTGGVADRFGNGSFPYSTLQICKVN